MAHDTNNKAVMLFDANCVFCRRWITRWRKITGNSIAYEPCQASLKLYPELTEEDCERAVQLVCVEGVIYSGAAAVFKSLDLAGKYSLVWRLYVKNSLFRRLSERGYRWVARNRGKL